MKDMELPSDLALYVFLGTCQSQAFGGSLVTQITSGPEIWEHPAADCRAFMKGTVKVLE